MPKPRKTSTQPINPKQQKKFGKTFLRRLLIIFLVNALAGIIYVIAFPVFATALFDLTEGTFPLLPDVSNFLNRFGIVGFTIYVIIAIIVLRLLFGQAKQANLVFLIAIISWFMTMGTVFIINEYFFSVLAFIYGENLEFVIQDTSMVILILGYNIWFLIWSAIFLRKD